MTAHGLASDLSAQQEECITKTIYAAICRSDVYKDICDFHSTDDLTKKSRINSGQLLINLMEKQLSSVFIPV